MEGLTFHTRAATAGCSFDHRLTEEEPCKALPGLVSARGATCLPWQPCDLPASKPPIQTSLASIPGYDSPRGRTDRGRFRTSFSSRGPSPFLSFCSPLFFGRADVHLEPCFQGVFQLVSTCQTVTYNHFQVLLPKIITPLALVVMLIKIKEARK